MCSNKIFQEKKWEQFKAASFYKYDRTSLKVKPQVRLYVIIIESNLITNHNIPLAVHTINYNYCQFDVTFVRRNKMKWASEDQWQYALVSCTGRTILTRRDF